MKRPITPFSGPRRCSLPSLLLLALPLGGAVNEYLAKVGPALVHGQILDGDFTSMAEIPFTEAECSFLLPVGHALQSVALGFPEDRPGQALQVSFSRNYREWYLPTGETIDASGRGLLRHDFISGSTRYLRLQGVHPAPTVVWGEILFGTKQAVAEAVAIGQPVDWGDITSPVVILDLLDRACAWQFDHLTNRAGRGLLDWVNAAFYTGVMALSQASGNSAYRASIEAIAEQHDWKLRLRTDGSGFRHADDHCMGQSYVELYLSAEAPDLVQMQDVKDRFDAVMADPKPGRVDYNWCDALFMGPPTWARLAAALDDATYLDYMNNLWWDSTAFLYDPVEHLYYRDQSYFDDREPNGEKVFWSRGNGWVIAGLVRILQFMPLAYPDRPLYESLLREMSTRLAGIQGENGLWTSSLLYPERFDFEPEVSGSAFFTYAIAYGVNEGILDSAVFGPVLERAWAGMTRQQRSDGHIRFIQQVGAGPARYDGIATVKDYGYGAYLLAGTEMLRYYSDRSATPFVVQNPARALQPVGRSIPDSAIGSTENWQEVETFANSLSAWTVSRDLATSNSLVAIIPDPFAAGGNQVLSAHAGDIRQSRLWIRRSIPAVAEGSTATIYQRFALSEPDIDMVFGLSDVANPAAYNDYETGLRFFDDGIIEARDQGSYVDLAEDFTQMETWYELWVVVDNGSDTYDVYLRGGSNFPTRTLLRTGSKFRNGTTSSLVSFLLALNTGTASDPKGPSTFYLDDLHVDLSGVNLTRPVAVRQPTYSPWSPLAMEPVSGAKDAPIGWIHDQAWPWIFHWGTKAWWYVFAEPAPGDPFWAWNAANGHFLWTADHYAGWFYDWNEAAWSSY